MPKPSIRLSARGKWIVWRARVGGKLHRWLRFATGLFVSALFALYSAHSAAQDQPGDDLTVAGIRLRTREGRIYEGLLLSGGTGRDFQVKNAEGTLVIPEDSVESREQVRLDVRRVYLPGEVLEILKGLVLPSSGEDIERPGAGLLRAKLRERALSAFRMAEILRHPDGADSGLLVQLARIRDRVEDLAIRRTVYQAQEGCLSVDYGLAVAQLGEVEKSIGGEPGALTLLAEVRRLQAQIEEGRGRARDEGIVEEIWRSLDASLKSLAMDRGLSLSDARAQVGPALQVEVIERVRKRLNFSPEDPAAKAAWVHRPGETRMRHSYGEASWVVLDPGARPLEEWWRSVRDEVRYALLKGLYIEKSLQVVHAGTKNCGGCGGTGLVGESICSVCEGSRLQRVVIYR